MKRASKAEGGLGGGRSGGIVRSLATLGLIAVLSSFANPAAAAGSLHRPADLWMVLPVVDRPEMHSFQPYAGPQFEFRPETPIQRGVKTKRPRVVMPKRVDPLIEYGGASPYAGGGYAYCVDPPGDFEP